MKKMTTYLKYKFKKREYEITSNDLNYLLPQSKRMQRGFDGNGNNSSQHHPQDAYQVDKGYQFNNNSPMLEQYCNMQDILLRLYPNTDLKQHLYELFVSVVPIANGMKNQLLPTNNPTTGPVASIFAQNPALQLLGQPLFINQGKNDQYLKSIHKIFVKFNRPKYYFLKLLMNSIVITKD